MKQSVVLLSVLLILSFVWATPSSLNITTDNSVRSANKVVINVDYKAEHEDDVWDTYLYFQDSRKTPVYVTVDGNSLDPQPLGMLPPTLELEASHWSQNETVEVHVVLCEYGTDKVLLHASTVVEVAATQEARSALPRAPKLSLNQETQTQSESRWYSDYKQFDSRWKYDRMGASGGTTIGKSGCAMSAAANIIRTTPQSLNNTLRSNGGYSGNYIIWSKVPGTSYYGSSSMSSSLFGSYHVIANVGGHFVLLTGASGSGFSSHDPGKSSNPVYSFSQIRDVRLYRK